jgi:hypothetical protein
VAQSREALLFAFSVSCLLHSTPVFACLDVQIETSTREYGEPAEFDLSVIVRSGCSAPVIVLPQSIRRNYVSVGSGAAQYSPFPGPPINPWQDAFLLRPSQSQTLMVRGMRDGDGVWNLERGRYEMSIRLTVTPEAAKASALQVKNPGAPIWEGDIRSSNIRVIYSPAPPAPRFGEAVTPLEMVSNEER